MLLLKRGAAENTYAAEGGQPLSAFIRDAMELGAKMYACTPAVQVYHLRMEDLIDGVEAAGAVSLLEETRSADTVLTI